MNKSVFLSIIVLILSQNSFADKKLTYKYIDNKIQCLRSSSSSVKGVISSSTRFGDCSIDETGALINENLYLDGRERTIWYDIKPKPRKGCGVKYNPKNGTSTYIKCF